MVLYAVEAAIAELAAGKEQAARSAVDTDPAEEEVPAARRAAGTKRKAQPKKRSKATRKKR